MPLNLLEFSAFCITMASPKLFLSALRRIAVREKTYLRIYLAYFTFVLRAGWLNRTQF
jgi:hypothetical protein